MQNLKRSKKLIALFVAGCIVLVSGVLILHNGLNSNKIVFSDYLKTYEHFEELEPLIIEYISGVEKAYNKSDKENLLTFELDSKTKQAGDKLSSYLDRYDNENVEKNERIKYLYFAQAIHGIKSDIAGIDFVISMMGDDDVIPNSKCFEDLRAAIDRAYENLSTEKE